MFLNIDIYDASESHWFMILQHFANLRHMFFVDVEFFYFFCSDWLLVFIRTFITLIGKVVVNQLDFPGVEIAHPVLITVFVLSF